MFEHPCFWLNLEENHEISFKEPNKKQLHGTRKNKKH